MNSNLQAFLALNMGLYVGFLEIFLLTKLKKKGHLILFTLPVMSLILYFVMFNPRILTSELVVQLIFFTTLACALFWYAIGRKAVLVKCSYFSLLLLPSVIALYYFHISQFVILKTIVALGIFAVISTVYLRNNTSIAYFLVLLTTTVISLIYIVPQLLLSFIPLIQGGTYNLYDLTQIVFYSAAVVIPLLQMTYLANFFDDKLLPKFSREKKYIDAHLFRSTKLHPFQLILIMLLLAGFQYSLQYSNSSGIFSVIILTTLPFIEQLKS